MSQDMKADIEALRARGEAVLERIRRSIVKIGTANGYPESLATNLAGDLVEGVYRGFTCPGRERAARDYEQWAKLCDEPGRAGEALERMARESW